MKQRRIVPIGAVVLMIAIALVVVAVKPGSDSQADATAAAPVPVLSVVMTTAQVATLPVRIPASGNIAAWQEASVGTEVDGLRLTEVKVNVGDTVRRGQLLAQFAPEMVAADLAEAQASVAQAKAQSWEAQANAERARKLDKSGAMSTQQVDQLVVAARTALARLDVAQAIETRHRLRLAQTRVLAPGDGIITSRSATVGAVMPAGQELFRLIQDGRLEWRATVAMADIARLAPGQRAVIAVHGQPPIEGRLRIVAPAIDAQTHTGLVYVDLPPGRALQAGAFARGHIEVGASQALTVPQGAVVLRDGFHYVMRLDPESSVMLTKVAVGRRVGERIEIVGGLAAAEAIVASGLSFLSEGDTVRVVRGAGSAGRSAAADPARPTAAASRGAAP
ncbi:efflux RND transporter periplasmic adaptor subunit [Xanthomonas sp. NCPPB 2654]|uniref:efflux RND transporter periplasmic adaptor subunit n=1 Tax=unclassified Xanthomonas TaxID=2643310 RepID=UPI0021E0ED9B|nr:MULTISPECIES: efflux RND transporter periplasmic adaptor subunit [unclassified Xanthomonas]MDL5365418.1 efflux RND transporter periplasmic adaptor subunit [Xanthomonas sp. NCPPB 2654]UYC20134.1 efflux RND transporter periplasmic adaptor subunit [Xanthomonas sp. CFBP 8443]